MHTHRLTLICTLLVMAATPEAILAEDAAEPGDLVEETPTLKCLGVRWNVAGDDNRNARVLVEYRQLGSPTWKRALDLFRVETRATREPERPPEGQTMFAGSIFDLEENTAYQVKLVLKDPDGGGGQRILRMKTWSEPQLPVGGRKIDVQPGGLRKALKESRPGDTLRLRQGVYRGTFRPNSGGAGKPIALVGAGDGETILDGAGGSHVISASGLHDVMLENLTLRNAKWGIAVNEGARITVRRCTIRDVDYGFVATRNGQRQQHFYLADNVLVGRSKWPRSEGIEPRRGVQLGGTGHVVCYNRISRFADAIDTFPAYPCAAIDFYGNEISECTDDGIEMDYSQHNTRCFHNRLTNVFQGISVQPIHGGPVYVFRNALYNVGYETFKMHNGPSGALMFHNTSVRAGMPLVLMTGEPVSNSIYRNNLFVGTAGNYAYESMAPMRDCDFDYDGFGGRWKLFLKFNAVRYPTMAAVRETAPVYRHAVRVDPARLFRSGVRPPADVKQRFAIEVNDLRLSRRNRAIDAGVVLANVNDAFQGTAPDLGAYEFGGELPHYGPRPKNTLR